MARTGVIHARTETTLKIEVEQILKKLGLSTTEAINLFFAQIKLRKGIPFPIEIPNAETMQGLKESESGFGVTKCKNADDMFKKLGI